MHPRFMDKLEYSWKEIKVQEGNKIETFQCKLKELKFKIKTWNKEECDNVFILKKKLEEKMEPIQIQLIKEGHLEALAEVEGRLGHDI